MDNLCALRSAHRRRARLWVVAVLFGLGAAAAGAATLRPDHPERYTVVKGDTLWGIAARFLKDPWRWPSVWKLNEQIKNPHLIYPGDVIALTIVGGEPQLTVVREEPPPAPALPEERLSPQVRVEPLARAIPTVAPEVIGPFLSQPLVVGKNELDKAPYVTTGQDFRVALGSGDEFFARGLGSKPAEYYQLFRPGRALVHPDTGEVLAYEAQHLGDAKLLEPGDPSKLVVTRVKQEILPTDRLIKAPKEVSLPHYFPRPPQRPVYGRILSASGGLREFGPLSVVAISLGRRDEMEEGHVLRILRHPGRHKDPLTKRLYTLPEEESGLLMVFRVFERVSYALVMDASRPIHIYDAVKTP
jgi:hypothetical protein